MTVWARGNFTQRKQIQVGDAAEAISDSPVSYLLFVMPLASGPFGWWIAELAKSCIGKACV